MASLGVKTYWDKGEPILQQFDDWDSWDFYQVYYECEDLLIMWGKQDYTPRLPSWMGMG